MPGPTPPTPVEPSPAGAVEAPQASPSKALRVLFIGNSYTFFNDLPEMFADLMRSGGYQVEVQMDAKGGWTLADHAASEQTLDLIETQDWDYIILQEQSVIPTIQEQREHLMLPAVRILDEKIRGSGAVTVLFMTWGRRDGLPPEGYPDFESMQAQLYIGYMEIGNELGAIVAPVGAAWQNAITQEPQLELWDADGSHPSESGSYLTACVFYAVIGQSSPEGLAYLAELDEEIAHFLQSNASGTVLENH